MCRKQGLDFRSERQQQWDAERAERRNQRGNGGYSRDTGYGSGHQQSYGGGRFPGDDGPYGGENRYGPMRSVAPSHQGTFEIDRRAVLIEPRMMVKIAKKN